MLWHVVVMRFRTSPTSEAEIAECRAALQTMFERSPEVLFYRIASPINLDNALLVMSGFESEASLATYMETPWHKATSALIRKYRVIREDEHRFVDAFTTDAVDALPRRAPGAAQPA